MNLPDVLSAYLLTTAGEFFLSILFACVIRVCLSWLLTL